MSGSRAPQLEFFDGGQVVEAASVLPQHSSLASALPRALRMGTMSWTFPGWTSLLYGPRTRDKDLVAHGLRAYAQHPLLRTVEIDRSFYEPLSTAGYAAYAEQTLDDFCFVAKAHEDCTALEFPPHARFGARAGARNPHLLDAAYASAQVVQPFVEGLRSKAGVLLFQFSPMRVRSPQRFAEKLHAFLRQLPSGVRYAVELRNRELLTHEYAQVLDATGAIHCHNAWSFMPSVAEQHQRVPAALGRFLLVRWLLRPRDSHQAARARYAPFDRVREADDVTHDAISDLVQRALRASVDTVVLVNNKAEGCAPESIFRLAKSIAEARSCADSSRVSPPG